MAEIKLKEPSYGSSEMPTYGNETSFCRELWATEGFWAGECHDFGTFFQLIIGY